MESREEISENKTRSCGELINEKLAAKKKKIITSPSSFLTYLNRDKTNFPLLCRKSFFFQFWIADMLSIDILLLLLSLHWTLSHRCIPDDKLGWASLWKGNKPPRSHGYYFTPSSDRFMLGVSQTNTTQRSLWASLEPPITLLLNVHVFLMLFALLFVSLWVFFLSFMKTRACPQCFPRDLNKVMIHCNDKP